LLDANLPVSGNTPLTNPENRAFYPALDGLRAIAFLLVFFHHYYMLPWGWTGVNIFFVLSGFLITGILFDSRNDRHRARNFYIRRSLRIFPLYYGVIFAALLLYPILHWSWSAAWLAWPLYLANFLPFTSTSVFLNGSPLQLAAFAWLRPANNPHTTFFLGHFWSLCVEEQFYFLWPWCVFWARNRRTLIWVCSVVAILGPFLRIAAQHAAPDGILRNELLYRATPLQLDGLLLGALVALLLRGPKPKRIFEVGTIITLYSALLFAFLLVIGIVIAYPNWRAGYPYPSWKFTWGLTFANLFTAGVILCAVQPSSFVYKLLSLRPLRLIGRISYGAYVFHDIFHVFYQRATHEIGTYCKFVADRADLFTLSLALTSTLLISWLSFHFYESRFINLKERWSIPEASLIARNDSRN
jgi:peptidoglycan/LPS O-acetylase OafA/YrhL